MESKIQSSQVVDKTGLCGCAQTNERRFAAKKYWKQVFCAIPTRASDQRADIEWRYYQSRRPNLDKIELWFSSKDDNIGIVCSCVSRGFIVFDRVSKLLGGL